MSEDLRLSLGGRRTMTSHRGKNKRRHPVSAPILHRALDDGGDIGDAAASDADCHPGAGPEPRREPAALELLACLATDIANAEVGEVLAGDEQAGWKHRKGGQILYFNIVGMLKYKI